MLMLIIVSVMLIIVSVMLIVVQADYEKAKVFGAERAKAQ